MNFILFSASSNHVSNCCSRVILFDPRVHGGMGPSAAASAGAGAGAGAVAALFVVSAVVSAVMSVWSWTSAIVGFGQILVVEMITKTP